MKGKWSPPNLMDTLLADKDGLPVNRTNGRSKTNRARAEAIWDGAIKLAVLLNWALQTLRLVGEEGLGQLPTIQISVVQEFESTGWSELSVPSQTAGMAAGTSCLNSKK